MQLEQCEAIGFEPTFPLRVGLARTLAADLGLFNLLILLTMSLRALEHSKEHIFTIATG